MDTDPLDTPSKSDLSSLSPALVIVLMGRKLRPEIDRDLANLGLTVHYLSVLDHLGREPGLSYSDLARRDGLAVPSMRSTLHQLEDLGAVERRTPPGRGRTAALHLTALGSRLRDAGHTALADIDRRLVSPLLEGDAEKFGTLLVSLFLGDRRTAQRKAHHQAISRPSKNPVHPRT